jgi:hypothetical protein
MMEFGVCFAPDPPPRRGGWEMTTVRTAVIQIRGVQNTWQFLRDRRPETDDELTELLP